VAPARQDLVTWLVIFRRALAQAVVAFNGPAVVKARDRGQAAVVFSGRLDPAKVAGALSDLESITERLVHRVQAKAAAVRKDPGCGLTAMVGHLVPVRAEAERKDPGFDLTAMVGHLVPVKAEAERSVPEFGLTVGQMAIGSPIVAPMATDFPTGVLVKAAAGNVGPATIGATGQPIIGPIEFPIVIGGMIGAAIVTTTAGNTGTVIGTIMITGSTTIGG
jgi:hypothetical protein